MTTDQRMAAALAYAEQLGWPVFALRGKVPAIPNQEPGGRGHLDATTDPETIRRFWARYPGSNIGVSCIASGFLVLDVDPRHGGDHTLTKIESRFGPLQPTVRQITGGGQHILFRETRDVHFRASIGRGVDVRYRGGIVVSPSVHPESGRQYTWTPGHHPLDKLIAEAGMAHRSANAGRGAVLTSSTMRCSRARPPTAMSPLWSRCSSIRTRQSSSLLPQKRIGSVFRSDMRH